MPDRSQQQNRELKRVAQSYSKRKDLFKKSRPDDNNLPITETFHRQKYARKSLMGKSETTFFKYFHQIFRTLDIFIYKIH